MILPMVFFNDMYFYFVGVWMGFQYVPALLVPQMCFQKSRVLAVAIANSGGPLGSFVFVLLMQVLIRNYGWRGAVFIAGAIVLHGCAFGIIVMPTKEVTSYSQKNRDVGSIDSEKLNNPTIQSANMKISATVVTTLKTICDTSILKSGTILGFVFFLWILFSLGYPVFANFLLLITSTYGISKDTASLMLSVFGFSEFFGRLSFGVVGSLKWLNTVYFWCFITVVLGVTYICLTWV